MRGGKTLTILNDAARKASGKTESLLQHLLETSAVPYMQQLYIWLTQGIVDDPYSEFLIEDNQVWGRSFRDASQFGAKVTAQGGWVPKHLDAHARFGAREVGSLWCRGRSGASAQTFLLVLPFLPHSYNSRVGKLKY